MCLLSEAFIKAQLLAEAGDVEPYHISIVWQLELDFKRKEKAPDYKIFFYKLLTKYAIKFSDKYLI